MRPSTPSMRDIIDHPELWCRRGWFSSTFTNIGANRFSQATLKKMAARLIATATTAVKSRKFRKALKMFVQTPGLKRAAKKLIGRHGLKVFAVLVTLL